MHRFVGILATTVAALALSAGPAAAKPHRAVCPGPSAAGTARCHAQVVTNAAGAPLATSTPAGYGPADLRSAYNLTATGSAATTIAIVDAYDLPSAESDLGVYRSQYGLTACTTANGCFRKVNQTGGSTPPRKNSGWGQEIALDIEMASAICPNCKILLIEANSNRFSDLAAAVNEAAALGANVISNSYGGSEFSGETSSEAAYNHPGVAVTVSSGDAGYGVEFPAASRYVTAVGGTSLQRAANARGWSETAWSGAGSGCSAYIAKPTWQTDAGCSRRTVADVSAVANPNTGVAVYDSTPNHGSSGWMVFGGTSVAAPVIGGVYGLAGNSVSAGSYPYSHTSSLYDIVAGSNGSCGGSYLCTAVAGFDGPTGLGTPNGTAAF